MNTYTVTDDAGHTATWDYDAEPLTDAVGGWFDMSLLVSGYGDTVEELLSTIDVTIGSEYVGTMTDALGLVIEPA